QAEIEIRPEGEVQPRLHGEGGPVDEGEDVAASVRLGPPVLSGGDVLPRVDLPAERRFDRDLPSRIRNEGEATGDLARPPALLVGPEVHRGVPTSLGRVVVL